MREAKGLRLFFALWPDDKVRDQIATFMAGLATDAGRVVPPYNWHLTLHFIGNTSFGEKSCLHRQARKVRAKPFQLTLDQTGFFKKPKVFWLGCDDAPQALSDVQEKLGKEISHCEFNPEKRHYSPHVTVARKVLKNSEINRLMAFPGRLIVLYYSNRYLMRVACVIVCWKSIYSVNAVVCRKQNIQMPVMLDLIWHPLFRSTWNGSRLEGRDDAFTA